jgi:hypothetical protein
VCKTFEVSYRVVCARCGSTMTARATPDRYGVVEVEVEPCVGCELWVIAQAKKQDEPCP